MRRIKRKLADPVDETLSDALSDVEIERQLTHLMKTVGARVREFRVMQGLRIRDVRDEHGVNVSQLSRIENGKQNLTLWTVVRLAYILGVHPWDFYVPRENAKALKPKRQRRPQLSKADLEEEAAAFQDQVAARIRALRRLQGMTINALAEFSGIYAETVAAIERGAFTIRASTAIRIADALGVQPHELYIPREQSGIRPRTKQGQGDDA